MTRHRVLHFLWHGGIGGAERAVYQVVREQLARDEWDVGVAFGRPQGPYAERFRSLGCEVLDLHMAGGADLRGALGQVPGMRRYDLHHFHLMQLSQFSASSRCKGAARVYTERGGLDDAYASRGKRARRDVGGVLLRRYFDAVAGNTRHALNVAVARYRLEGMPGLVTYNGIDFSLLQPAREGAEVRRQFGIDPGAMVVGSSGTFKGWKRFDRVVALLGARSDLHVLLIGDGALRPAFEAQARLIGAEDRLHITGLIENVAEYVAATDVFVLASSTAESFGNSVIESMALGIPSIVFSDSPGICEHMEHGVTGFVVDGQEGLASTVNRLAGDPGLRSEVGAAGAAHVRSKYTLEQMHEAYRRLYEIALERRAASRRGEPRPTTDRREP